ncbi:hypothetical protein BDQ17DRAFT_1278843 [Cyathus striatus]|nr:hypothetical protein BDQ17DRAFT_1278843 [Cyathus striatus]
MDIDPLADTVPPRYAVESDEEDEINPLHASPTNDTPPTVDVKIIGNLPTGNKLVIATGEAGRHWARGASLGEQTGAVMVNGVQIGLIFNPPWTKSTVMVSEALSRVPISSMHPYSEAVLDALKPECVSLLDSYAVPAYITNHPVSYDDAPIRYLSTSPTNLAQEIELFSPPNLIHSTSASFMSILAITNIMVSLILLPSPLIPHPAPKTIMPSNISHLAHDDVEWSVSAMNRADKLLFDAIKENIDRKWELKDDHRNTTVTTKTTNIGEGGMYI